MADPAASFAPQRPATYHAGAPDVVGDVTSVLPAFLVMPMMIFSVIVIMVGAVFRSAGSSTGTLLMVFGFFLAGGGFYVMAGARRRRGKQE